MNYTFPDSASHKGLNIFFLGNNTWMIGEEDHSKNA